jgi:hypothetical protein
LLAIAVAIATFGVEVPVLISLVNVAFWLRGIGSPRNRGTVLGYSCRRWSGGAGRHLLSEARRAFPSGSLHVLNEEGKVGVQQS